VLVFAAKERVSKSVRPETPISGLVFGAMETGAPNSVRAEEARSAVSKRLLQLLLPLLAGSPFDKLRANGFDATAFQSVPW